jgi:hypothetical protein
MTWLLRWVRKSHSERRSPRWVRAMEYDPNWRGHLPSRVPLVSPLGSPEQKILCPTSSVLARPVRKYQG